MTALSYLKKMGGRKLNLALLANKIFATCQLRHFTLKTEYISTRENLMADFQSRVTPHHADWGLHQQVFEKIQQLLGNNTIDLFASEENRKLRRFSSRTPQQNASFVNALVHDWRNEFPWINCPFKIIQQVLNKIQRE
jgi:hypothetical protein